MQLAPLTFKSIRARAVVLKLKRPVVARIATITEWPLILMTSSLMKASSGGAILSPTASRRCAIRSRPCKISCDAQGPTCRGDRACSLFGISTLKISTLNKSRSSRLSVSTKRTSRFSRCHLANSSHQACPLWQQGPLR